MPTERYEILILGSGAGGKLFAWDMAGAGQPTAVVERRWIGGSCPNINCLPSKNEIWSAKVADLVHHAAEFGLVTGPYKTDMRRVLEGRSNFQTPELTEPRLIRRWEWATQGLVVPHVSETIDSTVVAQPTRVQAGRQ